MKKISLTNALFLLLLSIGMAQEERIVVPMDLSTNRPIVDVMINGKGPYKFIFDTGSGTNVIDNGLVDELGIKLVGEDPLRSQGDSKLVSKRYEANEISMVGSGISKPGTLNGIDIRAMVQVDGIIGNNYAADYLVTLDYPGSQLIFEKRELNKSDPGVMAYIQQPRVINLNIDVSGETVETHLDTGNPGSFSLPYSLKDRLKFKAEPVKGSPIRTPVATYESWRAQLDGKIKVGDVVFEDPNVMLVEGFESANIGYGVLKDLQTSIDIKNHLISFGQSKGPEQKTETVSVPAEYQDFVGSYGNGVRKIFIEDGKLWAQRTGGPKLEMVPETGGLYQLTYVQQTQNELPRARFERDNSGKVIAMTYVLLNGNEDRMEKDN